MPDEPSVYGERGIPTVINAVGTHTRVSGSLIREGAVEAMVRASREFVHLADLQAYASGLIAEVTGAEAGLVTDGAAAGLTMSAAACMAGNDYAIMNRLPHTEGAANEIVIPRAHRNQYEVAFRAAGAELVGVGLNKLGAPGGREDVEPWEIENAIGDATAAVAYVDGPENRLALPEVVEIAHANDLPVIVDAAAELPPTSNLTRYVEEGADLVAFSGGKSIRGPQASGIIAGRKDLIASAAVQMLPSGVDAAVWDPPAELIDADDFPGMPRHGIGRPMKVGKEELMGLVRALELFVEEDDREVVGEWNARARHVAESLAGVEGLDPELTNPNDPDAKSSVVVGVDEERAGVSALELVRALHAEDPRVFVGESRVHQGAFTVDTQNLTDDEADYLVDRVRANLG